MPRWIKRIAPETARQLKTHGRAKIRAIISIACFVGLLAFIPSLLSGGPTSSVGLIVLAMSSGFVLFFIIPAIIFAIKLLGIADPILNDYTHAPWYIHWGIITVSVGGALGLYLIKILHEIIQTSSTSTISTSTTVYEPAN